MLQKIQSLSTAAIFLVAASLIFTACDSTSEDGSRSTFKVQLTDAPADYDAVNIDIQAVRLHKKEEAEMDSSDSGSGWITILEEPLEVDLLELTNGNEITLGAVELEPGHYSQLRFVLGENNTITVDGQTMPLTTPSAQQSGLKLQLDANVEAGETYTLLVDFDAARSIVEAGNSGKYILKPVLHTVNLAEAGSISGTVQPAISDSTDVRTHVMAITNGDTLSTITADNGDFTIMGLLPATYDVVFDPDTTAYADTTVMGVQVTANEVKEMGTIQLPRP